MASELETKRELSEIRRALDQSAIVAVTDRAGNIIHVNDKFCEISQYSREELLGKNHRIINSGYHGKDFFVDMWKTISSGEIWEGEVRNRAKDGSYYWVNTTIVPFMGEDGRPHQYVSIRYEITQRKQAEEQLRVYADRLERSNRELQDFASVAAHDLQEPLRKILAFGDRLESKFKDQLPEGAREYLEKILSSAGRMRRLIDDLLTYSRVSSRAMEARSTDLNQVVAGVLSDLEVRLELTKGRVVVDKLPTLPTDPSQMHQLFLNLISNALKFQRPGVPPEVRISTESTPGYHLIRVSDNGIGFDEKYVDKIFTIFQRLHGRQEYEGTGVGLAVCRRIAERHGGTLNAKSKPGEGSVFMIQLPKGN